MIKDLSVRTEIDQEWTTVRVFTSFNRTRIIPSLIVDETPPDEFYNLPLVLAYCALDDALKQLCIEGVFSCTKNNLSGRMQHHSTARLLNGKTTISSMRGVAHVTSWPTKRCCIQSTSVSNLSMPLKTNLRIGLFCLRIMPDRRTGGRFSTGLRSQLCPAPQPLELGLSLA